MAKTPRTPSTPPPRPAKRGRALSRAEIELWRSVLRDTLPLPGRALPPLPPDPVLDLPDEIVAPAAARPRRGAGRSVLAEPPPARPLVHPTLEVGRVSGIDKRQAERLKRGRTEIDARLDLHGMTQAEAQRRLVVFVEASVAAGRRCVLVITGKGLSSQMRGLGGGVLREAVPRWLNEAPLRSRILAVTHAQPKHGGEGALYVLLKRSR